MRISLRRQQMIELYLQGKTLTEIADEIGFDRVTLWRDLRVVRKEWLKNRVDGYGNYVEAELSKLDKAEHEAWLAWEASKNPKVVIKSVESDGPHGAETREERTETPQVGNPSFLAEYRACIESRRKLLGLDAPTKIAPVTPEGDAPYTLSVDLEKRASELTDEQLQAIVAVRSVFSPEAGSLNTN